MKIRNKGAGLAPKYHMTPLKKPSLYYMIIGLKVSYVLNLKNSFKSKDINLLSSFVIGFLI